MLYGWLAEPPPTHPFPLTCPPPCSAVLKLMHTLKNHLKQPEIQSSAIYKVSYVCTYMKANGLLSLLLIIKASKLQAAVRFNQLNVLNGDFSK